MDDIEDKTERRRAQNRYNQQALRRRKRQLKDAECAPHPVTGPVKRPALLPKSPPLDPTEVVMMFPGYRGGEILAGQKSLDTPSRLRPVSLHDIAGTGLDLESRRIFHYASTCLWASFSQQVIETSEPLAIAMSRLSIANELTMQTFLWTAANELEMHRSHPTNRRVMLQQQNRAISRIQRAITTGDTSDEVVNAVYALVSSSTPAGVFNKRTSTPHQIESPYGHFDPPLTFLGSIDHMSQFSFDDHHAAIAVSLLEPRGGLWGMEIVEFAYQIQALDLLRNSKSGSKPPFNLCKSYRHILDVQMPIYRATSAFQEWPISSDFSDVFLDLRCYLRQVHLYTTKAQPTVPTATLVAWRNINHHRVLSLPNHKDQLFRLSVLIFSYNVTFPVPYRNLVQQWVCELLPHIYEETDSSEAALWAVVIAAISAPGVEVAGHLINEARRLKFAMKLEDWSMVKTIMTKYLWLESACDTGGEIFWNLVNGSSKVRDLRESGEYELAAEV